MSCDRGRVVPLGGLGEIGMNCMVLEHQQDALVIDCGVLFPDDEAPGVDVIVPDFQYLMSGQVRPLALVLTHGHEDHIGAVPYLLRRCDISVFGPPLALALVRERLKEHDIGREPKLVEMRPGQSFEVGPFKVEPIRVTHSIPDAVALCIDTPAGRVLHSGDFKIDRTPVGSESFDEERIRAVSRAGVALLLSDSTNSEVPGSSGSESDVRETLSGIVQAAKGAVFASLFSSNVFRLQILFDAARAHGRRVVLLGRSLLMHERVGREVGFLQRPSDIVVSAESAASLPRKDLLVLVSGSQGEPGSALTRLASGDPSLPLQIERGDTAVMSSRIIPGHERSVQRMLDALARRGALVVHKSIEPLVHVSGHAQRSEQLELIDMVRPAAFVPIHGNRVFLERHADLARSAGIDGTVVVEDGQAVAFGPEGLARDGDVPHGRVHIDGSVVGPEALRDRRLLAESGFAVVVLPYSRLKGRLEAAPVVSLRGVVEPSEHAGVAAAAAAAVTAAIEGLPAARRSMADEVRETARIALRRFLRRQVGRRPQAQAIVVEPHRGDGEGHP